MSIVEQTEASDAMFMGGPRDAEILYDDVTGLPRFSLFRTQVKEIIKDSPSKNLEAALVAFDLANFKAYNRQYGFSAGDDLLRKLGTLIGKEFPEQPVMRFVEDRFYVFSMLPDVKERITRLHSDVRELKNSKSVHLKVGIYMLTDPGEELSLAMDMARLACDSIKGREGFYYRIYDDEFDRDFVLERHIVDHIDEAIQKRWIEVWYQPVARAQTGRICGFEA